MELERDALLSKHSSDRLLQPFPLKPFDRTLNMSKERNTLSGPVDSTTQFSEARLCVQKNIDALPMYKVAFMACVIGLANTGDAVEISKVGFFLPDLPDITAFQSSFLTSSVFAGMFFGGVFLGQLSDRIGRRKTYIGTLAVNSLAGLCCSIFPSLDVVICFRFLGGVAIGGSFPVIFTYAAELFPTALRGKVISIIGSFFMVGAVYVALVAWAMLADNETTGTSLSTPMRYYVAFTCIPVVLACITAYFVLPESPLYLYDHGKYEELFIVLKEHYGSCDKDLRIISNLISQTPPCTRDYTHSHSHTQSEPETMCQQYGCSQIEKTIQSLRDSPALLKQAILLLIIYTSLAFASYGITTWISLLYKNVGITNEYKAALIFASAQLPANVISVYFIDSVGRKRLLVWGLGCSMLCAAAFGLDYRDLTVVIVFSALFNMFTVIAWNSLNCFSVESFPTRIRASTMGILGAAGRISAGIAQFTNAYLAQDVLVLLFITAIVLFAGTVSAQFLFESNHKMLKDSPEQTQTHEKEEEMNEGNGDEKVHVATVTAAATAKHKTPFNPILNA